MFYNNKNSFILNLKFVNYKLKLTGIKIIYFISRSLLNSLLHTRAGVT